MYVQRSVEKQSSIAYLDGTQKMQAEVGDDQNVELDPVGSLQFLRMSPKSVSLQVPSDVKVAFGGTP